MWCMRIVLGFLVIEERDLSLGNRGGGGGGGGGGRGDFVCFCPGMDEEEREWPVRCPQSEGTELVSGEPAAYQRPEGGGGDRARSLGQIGSIQHPGHCSETHLQVNLS